MSHAEKLVDAFLIEMCAWRARNAARSKLRDFYRKHKNETDGGWFDEDGAEPKEIRERDLLKSDALAAQKKLNAARASTRRHAKNVEQQRAKEGGA